MEDLIISAEEARKRTEESQGALVNYYKNIGWTIKERVEMGHLDAWVDIPINQLESVIKKHLKELGYEIGNRDGFKVIISW